MTRTRITRRAAVAGLVSLALAAGIALPTASAASAATPTVTRVLQRVTVAGDVPVGP